MIRQIDKNKTDSLTVCFIFAFDISFKKQNNKNRFTIPFG